MDMSPVRLDSLPTDFAAAGLDPSVDAKPTFVQLRLLRVPCITAGAVTLGSDNAAALNGDRKTLGAPAPPPGVRQPENGSPSAAIELLPVQLEPQRVRIRSQSLRKTSKTAV